MSRSLARRCALDFWLSPDHDGRQLGVTVVRMALCCLLAGLALAVPLPAVQDPADVQAGRETIPFDAWVAAGERRQIPWKISLREQRMRADLRLTSGFTVTVPARELNRLGSQHELFLLACVADQQGNWFDSYGLLKQKIDQPLPSGQDVSLAMSFVVRPGHYKLTLILYDRVTGLRSLTTLPLRIHPVRNDPLPNLYRDLPAVEFAPLATGVDRFLEPKVASRLWLPVEAHGSPRIDVLMNFGLSGQGAGPGGDNRRLWILARTLRLFSQLQAPPGALRITGVDASARRMLFVLDDMRNIPWDTVRNALDATRIGTVSADSLAGRERNAWFFRDTIDHLLAPATAAGETPVGTGESSPAASGSADAKRVLIVVSNPVDFSRTDARLPRAEDCNCRVFYFCYRFVDIAAVDDLGGLLSPLKPRRFDLYSPEDVRKAVAAVLREIHQP